MAIETSPENPAPVRQITPGDRPVDRPARARSGSRARSPRSAVAAASNTVFLTLRDKLADISVQVTCNRGGARLAADARSSRARRSSATRSRRSTPTAARLSLAVREIRLVGEGELLARLERRRQLLAAEGLFAAELKRPLPFLPRTVGLVTAQGSAAERDVLENAQPALAGRPVRRCGTPRCRACTPRREVIEAVQALDRDPAVDVIVVARGGGSVEDLLPFSDEAPDPRRRTR